MKDITENGNTVSVGKDAVTAAYRCSGCTCSKCRCGDYTGWAGKYLTFQGTAMSRVVF